MSEMVGEKKDEEKDEKTRGKLVKFLSPKAKRSDSNLPPIQILSPEKLLEFCQAFKVLDDYPINAKELYFQQRQVDFV